MTTTGNKSPRQILVIEDNEAEINLLKASLHDEVQRIVVVRTWDELQAQCGRADEFDAILVDLQIPGSPDVGLETLRRITARYPKTPAIVVTGHSDPLVAEEAIRTGAVDFVSKGPLWWEQIPQALRHCAELSPVLALLAT